MSTPGGAQIKVLLADDQKLVSTGFRVLLDTEDDILVVGDREVLRLVGQGLSNAEIATALTLSPATARTHVSRAMVKLRARDRAQLVVIAYQTGLLDPAA